MKSLVAVLCLLTSQMLFAQDNFKHMVSFNRQGFGWAAGYEEMNKNNPSPFNGAQFTLNDLAFNYTYRISTRWQVGGFYVSGNSEYEFRQSGKDEFHQVETTAYGVIGIYNFSDDLANAYYLGGTLSWFDYEQEISAGLSEAEGKKPFELDDVGNTYELFFGKRFSLEFAGIKNLTYSPNVSLYYKNHGKDFDDQGLGRGLGSRIQPVKFDLLF